MDEARAYDSLNDGNRAAAAIWSALTDLAPNISQVVQIDTPQDRTHADILAFLSEISAPFHVQAKKLSRNNRKLEIKHFEDWLRTGVPTVLMWRDNETRKIYWADMLRFLFRTGGTKDRKTATVNEQHDMHELDVTDEASKAKFVSRIRALCEWWPDRNTRWRVEIPQSLVDVCADPDVLLYLPVSLQLVDLLDVYMGCRQSRFELSRKVLQAARNGVDSPYAASIELIRQCGLPERDRDLLRRVEECFRGWRDRIPRDRKKFTKETLWAFDKLQSLFGYQQSGDLWVPEFRARNTYPISRLINLLPEKAFIEPLRRVLEQDTDLNALLYASWCLGNLNLNRPATDELWREVRTLRIESLRSRTDRIGEKWTLVDRQLRYTEAQLGSGEGQQEFERKLTDDTVGQFEAAYNFAYYSGDRHLIRDRFERRLDEGYRTDMNVRTILALDYNHLQKFLKVDDRAWRTLRPQSWRP